MEDPRQDAQGECGDLGDGVAAELAAQSRATPGGSRAAEGGRGGGPADDHATAAATTATDHKTFSASRASPSSSAASSSPCPSYSRVLHRLGGDLPPATASPPPMHPVGRGAGRGWRRGARGRVGARVGASVGSPRVALTMSAAATARRRRWGSAARRLSTVRGAPRLGERRQLVRVAGRPPADWASPRREPPRRRGVVGAHSAAIKTAIDDGEMASTWRCAASRRATSCSAPCGGCRVYQGGRVPGGRLEIHRGDLRGPNGIDPSQRPRGLGGGPHRGRG